MAINFNGRVVVKNLRSDFKKEFGLTLRVYNGSSYADEKATLASIRKGNNAGGEISPGKNTLVKNLESKVYELFGIKVQVAGSDDSYLCDNNITLAAALEADEMKLARKKSRQKNEVDKMDYNEVDEDTEITTDQIVNILAEWVLLKHTGKAVFDEMEIIDSDYFRSISIVFDGHPLLLDDQGDSMSDDQGNDIEDLTESSYYIYFEFIDKSHNSLSLISCVEENNGDPKINLDYTKEMYESDVGEQLKDSGISREEFEEDINYIYENHAYLNYDYYK